MLWGWQLMCFWSCWADDTLLLYFRASPINLKGSPGSVFVLFLPSFHTLIAFISYRLKTITTATVCLVNKSTVPSILRVHHDSLSVKYLIRMSPILKRRWLEKKRTAQIWFVANQRWMNDNWMIYLSKRSGLTFKITLNSNLRPLIWPWNSQQQDLDRISPEYGHFKACILVWLESPHTPWRFSQVLQAI